MAKSHGDEFKSSLVFTLTTFGQCPFLPIYQKKRKRKGKNTQGNYITLLITGPTRSRINITISSINLLQRALAIRSLKVLIHSLTLRSTQLLILSMAAFCNFQERKTIKQIQIGETPLDIVRQKVQHKCKIRKNELSLCYVCLLRKRTSI